MRDFLRITLYRDTDGTGELLGEVVANRFSGHGSAWFDLHALEQFGVQLGATYPLSASQPLAIRGGFWSKANPSVLDQEHLALEFYPIGLRGEVACSVRFSTPVHEHDRPEGQYALAVELKTSYEEIKSFAASLVNLAQGFANEAVLQAA